MQPEFYDNDQLVGIYNPNSGTQAEYKIGDGEWKDYSVPFSTPAFESVTVTARIKGTDVVATKSVCSNNYEINAYSDFNTDFTVTCKSLSFSFNRIYFAGWQKWYYSTDSSVYYASRSSSVIYAQLTDGSYLTFAKVNDNLFKDEIKGYELSLSRNADGTLSEYLLNIDGISYHYTANGKLSSVSDKYGNSITIERTTNQLSIGYGDFRYIVATNRRGVASVTDPQGGVMNYTYTSGYLTQVTDQTGAVIGKYEYTLYYLTKNMDCVINYDGHDRVRSYVYDSGAHTNFTYNDQTNTVSVSDSAGNSSSVTYNDSMLVESCTDETGVQSSFVYDEYGRVLRANEGGDITRTLYDSQGRTARVISPEEYNASYDGLPSANTYSDTNSGTTYTYNSDNLLEMESCGDTDTEYSYNALGDVTNVSTTTRTYSGTGDNQTCDVDVVTDSYGYDDGLVTSNSNSESGENTVYEYDANGNVTKETVTKDNVSTVTEYTYDSNSNLLTQKVNNEVVAQYVYDGAGRQIKATESGEVTRTLYDSLGRVVQTISSADYDSSKDGLPSANTYSDANAGTTYVYATDGTLTSEKDRLGRVTQYFYTNGVKTHEVFDIYDYYYFSSGELKQVKVGGAVTVTYAYNDDGDLTTETFANGNVIRYAYDEDGNLVSQYKNSSQTPYLTYSYNSDGELSSKVDSSSGLHYVYGENGAVSVYKSADNSLLYSYTSSETTVNNVTTTNTTENHFGQSLSTVLGDSSVSYTLGGNSAQYSLGYNSADKLTSDTAKYNGRTVITSSYQYDANDNISTKTIALNSPTDSSSVDLVNTYDSKDRITSETFGEFYNTYSYDSNDQLSRVNNGLSNYTSAYSYDSRGNITSRNYYEYTTGDLPSSPETVVEFSYSSSDWVDKLTSVKQSVKVFGQLTEISNTALTYDANGNVLTFGSKSFSWGNGRTLNSITDGENSYSYKYDESGIRTSKTVNGVTTYFDTSDGQILSQSDGTNKLIFQYDYYGNASGFTLNGNQYFYFTNAQGDVLGLTDENGNSLAQYYYDEWGTVTNVEGNQTIGNLNPIRYRGYYYDTETGYYYLQSRYYAPLICRFINADVYNDTQSGTMYSTNMYIYCENDPVNDSDPKGTYSASKALAYATNWWNDFNPAYKTIRNGGDCANFVSQCLHNGGLSKMTSEWYNYRKKVFKAISHSWGNAQGLYNWMKKYHSAGIESFHSINSINNYIKKMHNKYGKSGAKCKFLIFSNNIKKKKDIDKIMNHAMIMGDIVYCRGQYHMFYFAHTNARCGNYSQHLYNIGDCRCIGDGLKDFYQVNFWFLKIK